MLPPKVLLIDDRHVTVARVQERQHVRLERAEPRDELADVGRGHGADGDRAVAPVVLYGVLTAFYAYHTHAASRPAPARGRYVSLSLPSLPLPSLPLP